jgi:hypothetical protein
VLDPVLQGVSRILFQTLKLHFNASWVWYDLIIFGTINPRTRGLSE